VDAKNLSSSQTWTVSGEGSGEPDKLTAAADLAKPEMVHHMQNWIESIRNHKEPIAPIEAGYSHSVAVLMAEEALTTGRRMSYDHQRRELVAR
jgi:hypothetical protein